MASFTKIKENNLMWSHYTDNYKGICVEYDDALIAELKGHDKYITKSDVKYVKQPPTIDNLECIESHFNKICFYKQEEWRYEREIRVVIESYNKTEYIPIDNKLIKSIYLGTKTPVEICKRLVEICKKNEIKLFHTIALGNTYEVQFEEYKENRLPMKAFGG
jgi:hypothetical protein